MPQKTFISLILIFLIACQSTTPTPTVEISPTSTALSTFEPTPSPTSAPPSSLTEVIITATNTAEPAATAMETLIPTETPVPTETLEPTPTQLPTIEFKDRAGTDTRSIIHNHTATRVRVRDCTGLSDNNPANCPQVTYANPACPVDSAASGELCYLWVLPGEIQLAHRIHWPFSDARYVWAALQDDFSFSGRDYWTAVCYNGISLLTLYPVENLFTINPGLENFWPDVFEDRFFYRLDSLTCFAPVG